MKHLNMTTQLQIMYMKKKPISNATHAGHAQSVNIKLNSQISLDGYSWEIPMEILLHLTLFAALNFIHKFKF